MALGATPKQVVRFILATTSRALLLGLVVGLMDAIVGSNVLKSYLYGVSPLDPIALGAVICHSCCGSLGILRAGAPGKSYRPTGCVTNVLSPELYSSALFAGEKSEYWRPRSTHSPQTVRLECTTCPITITDRRRTPAY